MAKQIIIKGTPVVGADEVLVADSNSKIPAVDGSLVTTIAAGNITTGTIPTARLDTGTTANKVVVVGASGLPAVDGSLLTGIVSYTKSASDPTISTNPATGVGTEWVNHTSGKQFICTDATAGANVWKASGGGTGSIAPFAGWGSTYAFAAIDNNGAVDRYAFGSSSSGSNVLALSVNRKESGASSSSTHGYRIGGYTGSADTNIIDRFTFSSLATAVDHGDLSRVIRHPSCTQSDTHGFRAGGYFPDDQSNDIEKFSFASIATIVDVGDLAMKQYAPGAGCSTTHGYVFGGQPGSAGYFDTIQKYSLSSTGNATDQGNLSTGHTHAASCQSNLAGYSMGGNGAGSGTTVAIDKVTWASDTSGSNIGNLTVARAMAGGGSSNDHGYAAGGTGQNVIDRFSFSSDGGAVDVGDLSASGGAWGNGNHV